ncbi:hypothetical protein BDB00DRAFT_880135 [Zychaea mexicana]|uniref:uncharacterized protein n=1 Tax=Zychaea mexicana TaxID=64656 RepID=UPI0022FE1C19|nr:uncharacterized protein BDB00DRAFT_880135 [Zychaea mexicana]KAI9470432.1 hypothetical protein BDB00DRAFT_880135 [Zychaea mexicana]
MLNIFLLTAALFWSYALAQTTSVDDTGFNQGDNEADAEQKSWLEQNHRYVFVIVIGVLVLALLIWYIVRSVKGMRKRLEHDNEKQLYMIQQATAGGGGYQSPINETIPVSQHGYQKFDSPANAPVYHTHRY